MYVKYELSFPYDIFSLETDRPNDRQTHTCSYIYINVPSHPKLPKFNEEIKKIKIKKKFKQQ